MYPGIYVRGDILFCTIIIDELIEEGLFEHLLVDTGYQSFTVFRNPA